MKLNNLDLNDLFWIIGWLEGEGCFSKEAGRQSPIISGESKDEDTIDKICNLLNCNKYYVKNRNPDKWSDTYRFRIQRLSNIEFLDSIYVFFGERRQEQIIKALSDSKTECRKIKLDDFLINKFEISWLAGYLEGEGSFCSGPPSDPNMSRIQIQTTDEDIAIKISKIFGVKYHKTNIKNKKFKQSYSVLKRGKSAVDLMKSLKPHMSKRRQEQIDKSIQSYSVTKRIIKNAKFSQQDIAAIKAMRAGGMKVRSIAKYLDVSHSSISRICNGKSYLK